MAFSSTGTGSVLGNAPVRVSIREQSKKMFLDAFAESGSDCDKAMVAVANEIEAAIFDLHADEKTKGYRSKLRAVVQNLKGSRNASIRTGLLRGAISAEEAVTLDAKALEAIARQRGVSPQLDAVVPAAAPEIPSLVPLVEQTEGAAAAAPFPRPEVAHVQLPNGFVSVPSAADPEPKAERNLQTAVFPPKIGPDLLPRVDCQVPQGDNLLWAQNSTAQLKPASARIGGVSVGEELRKATQAARNLRGKTRISHACYGGIDPSAAVAEVSGMQAELQGTSILEASREEPVARNNFHAEASEALVQHLRIELDAACRDRDAARSQCEDVAAKLALASAMSRPASDEVSDEWRRRCCSLEDHAAEQRLEQERLALAEASLQKEVTMLRGQWSYKWDGVLERAQELLAAAAQSPCRTPSKSTDSVGGREPDAEAEAERLIRLIDPMSQEDSFDVDEYVNSVVNSDRFNEAWGC